MVNDKVNVLRESFKALHEKILNKAKNNGGPRFDQRSEVLQQYGRGPNPSVGSIAHQMMAQFSFLASPENQKKAGFRRAFTGKVLYDTHNAFRNGAKHLSVRSIYLDYWSKFVGFADFDEFLSDFKARNQSAANDQISAMADGNSVGEHLTQIGPDPEQVGRHLFGFYSGYFLLSKKQGAFGSGLSKLTLLIHPKSNEVFMRTVRMREKGIKYYLGHSSIVGNILYLKFKEQGCEFQLTLDITKRKNPGSFDRYLKGVYGGADPITSEPSAGRLILFQEKSWSKLCEEHEEDKIAIDFQNQEEFEPSLLGEDQSFELLSASEPNQHKDDLPVFFLHEDRYMENIRALDRFIFNHGMFGNFVGRYTVYSLQSTGLFLSVSPAFIFNTGHVKINGRKLDKRIRRYEGTAKMIGSDRLFISVSEIEDAEDFSMHYLSVHLTHNEGEDSWFNGVKIRRSEKNRYKPIASRVIFVKEPLDINYNPNEPLKQVPIFPKNYAEQRILDEFIENNRKPILDFLTGPEDNLLKTFDIYRIKENLRDLDYGLTFIKMAEYYTQQGDRDNTLINLYYAQLHGINKVEQLNDQIKKLFGIENDISKERRISVKQFNGEWLFEIANIQGLSLR